MEESKHWAESLEIGDRCKATIRHKNDGSKNIVNANAIVLDNSIATRSVIVSVSELKGRVKVPYSELSKQYR